MISYEQRAQKIINDKNWQDIDYIFDGEQERRVDSVDTHALAAEITDAIRAAVLADRERASHACEAIADSLPPGVYYEDFKAGLRQAIAAIRA